MTGINMMKMASPAEKRCIYVTIMLILCNFPITDSQNQSQSTTIQNSTITKDIMFNTTNGTTKSVLDNTINNLKKTTNAKTCQLRSTDPYVYNKIQDILSYKVKLLEYNLQFEEYKVNPLTVNCTWTYRGNKWARAYSQHGQTLLSLAFNYGIMSLMTLTLGVENLRIPLVDNPKGCIQELSEDERIKAVMYLLMRDFKPGSANITIQDQERICHEVILRKGQYAKFTDRCCHINPITKQLKCTTDIINVWLKILFFCLASVKFGLLFFGPIWFIPLIESIAKQSFPYVIKLKDPLVKTIYLCNSETHVNKTYDKVLDLRGKKGFEKLRESMDNIPVGEPVKVKFTRYDITVNYKRLLVENDIPVGVISSFIDALCRCKISQIGPFRECCQTNICKMIHSVDKEVTWYDFFKQFIKVVIVFVLPFPFYLRLMVFYVFESKDIYDRKALLNSMDLKEEYNGAILAYLTPTHPVFVCIYLLYFTTAITFGLVARGTRKEKLKRTIIGSFRDLKGLSWIDALGVFVGNMIWPFKRFGGIGCIIAPIYWLVIFPISILMYAFYCLPSIYVAFRMMVYSPDQIKKARKASGMYRIEKQQDYSMYNFDTEALLNTVHSSGDSISSVNSKPRRTCEFNRNVIEHVFVSLLCILTMFGVLLVMAECMGFIVELLVFTMMGVIVNAGAVLKYVTLLILVVVYSYDCYNNVGKKYLKLNKSLFNELKGRCKEIEKVTSLPSHLQENYGFKSQELSEQADYEAPDDIDDSRRMHWMLNDLVLFVDNEDMPRIPKRLFEEICEIRVAGAPGPVHQSLIEATQEFLKIMMFIFFVFIVVLTFGQVYRVSSTNQMLATLAGGFLPFLMRTFMAPSKPDIELGTVSFKSKLDEIIKNFRQSWPIYDFPFEPWTEEDEKKLKEAEEEKDDDKKSHNTDKDENSNVDKDIQNESKQVKETIDSFDGEKQLLLKGDDFGPGNGLIQNVDIELVDTTIPEKSEFDVDILVYLPNAQKQREKWLEQWSDFDEMSDVDNTSVLDFYSDATKMDKDTNSVENVV